MGFASLVSAGSGGWLLHPLLHSAYQTIGMPMAYRDRSTSEELSGAEGGI